MNGHVVAVAARTAEQAQREAENSVLNELAASLQRTRRLPLSSPVRGQIMRGLVVLAGDALEEVAP